MLNVLTKCHKNVPTRCCLGLGFVASSRTSVCSTHCPSVTSAPQTWTASSDFRRPRYLTMMMRALTPLGIRHPLHGVGPSQQQEILLVSYPSNAIPRARILSELREISAYLVPPIFLVPFFLFLKGNLFISIQTFHPPKWVMKRRTN